MHNLQSNFSQLPIGFHSGTSSTSSSNNQQQQHMSNGCGSSQENNNPSQEVQQNKQIQDIQQLFGALDPNLMMSLIANNSAINCEASTSQQQNTKDQSNININSGKIGETNNNNSTTTTTTTKTSNNADSLNLAAAAQMAAQQSLLMEVLNSNPALASAAMDFPELLNAAVGGAGVGGEIGKSQMQDMADMLMGFGFSPEMLNMLSSASNATSASNGQQQQNQWELSNSQSNDSLNKLTTSPHRHKSSIVPTSTTSNTQQQQQNSSDSPSTAIQQQQVNNNFMDPMNLLQMLSNEFMNSTGAANNPQAQQLFMAAAAEALQSANIGGSGGNGGDLPLSALNLNNTNGVSSNGGGASTNGGWDLNTLAALLSNSNGQFGYSSSPSKSLDSYCEICDKNLCNRYFLKTHKLKKHGISDDGTGSPTRTIPPFSLNDESSINNNQTANRSLNTSLMQSTLSNLQQQQQNQSVIMNHNNNNEIENIETLPPNAKMPKIITSTSSYAGTPVSSSSESNSIPANNNPLLGKNPVNLFTALKQNNNIKTEPGLNGEKSSSLMESATNLQINEESNKETTCERCGQDFPSRIDMLQHRISEHGIDASARDSSSPSSNANSNNSHQDSNNNKFNSMANHQQQIATNLLNQLQLPFLMSGNPFGELDVSKLTIPNGSSGQISTSNMQNGNKTAVKRQYSSTTKNYCSICNKEVCNKYFLKTHLRKMHNVDMEDLKNGNFSDTEKRVYSCDSCTMQFKTRPDLREHKRQVHGVSNMQTPPTSANDVVGNNTPSCSKTSSSVGQFANSGNHFFGQSMDDDDGGEENVREISGIEQQLRNSVTKKQLLTANVAQLLKDFSNGQSIPIAQMDGQINSINNKQVNNAINNNNNTNNHEAIPSSSASTSSIVYEAAHSATSSSSTLPLKCGYCEAEFPDESKLQCHRAEHVASFFGGQIPQGDENDLVIQVAHKMLQNNKEQISKLNPEIKKFPCKICLRKYESYDNLQKHIKMIHESPPKLSKLSILKRRRLAEKQESKPKLRYFRNYFKCGKCSRRFATKLEHSAHLAEHCNKEELAKKNAIKLQQQDGNNNNNENSMNNNKQQNDVGKTFNGAGQQQQRFFDPLMEFEPHEIVNQVVRELHADVHAEKSHGKNHQMQEKNSHTSGSASPMSSVHTTEGFCQPNNDEKSSRFYAMQKFTLRQIAGEDGRTKPHSKLFEEMLAHFPVRSYINEPITITIQLQPTEASDDQAEVLHL